MKAVGTQAKSCICKHCYLALRSLGVILGAETSSYSLVPSIGFKEANNSQSDNVKD